MRATSHPTSTFTIFLAPAMCKGENILVPWEYLFPNEKAWHVKFSPSQIPEQSQQELSEYCVEKQNQTIFKMVNYSQSHLVENIQVYQSSKNGAAQERGKNHGAWAALFLGAVWRQGIGLSPISPGFVVLVSFTPVARRQGAWTPPAILPSVSTPVPREGGAFRFFLQSTQILLGFVPLLSPEK